MSGQRIPSPGWHHYNPYSSYHSGMEPIPIDEVAVEGAMAAFDEEDFDALEATEIEPLPEHLAAGAEPPRPSIVRRFPRAFK